MDRMIQGMYETFRDNDRFPAFWECKNGGCLPHFHSSLELSYVTEGTMGAMINGQIFSIRTGQLLMVPSYTAHAYLDGDPSKSILIIVPLDFIPLYAPLFSKKVFAQSISREKFLNDEVLHCLRMILGLGPCSEQNENLVRSYIYVILGLLIQKIGLADTPKGRFLLKDILMYLQDNCLRPITLDSLSRKFGYSKYRFSHLFNEGTGCPLTQYIGSLRAHRAANLLRESESPLLEVAMNSGFDSLRTFYRSFKKNFGMTPTEYRHAIRDGKAGRAATEKNNSP